MKHLKIHKNPHNTSQNGFILPLIFIVTALVISVIVYVIGLSITNHQIASKDNSRNNAQLAADAGLDKSLMELTNNNTWTGTGVEVELYNNGIIRTTYQVFIIDSPTVVSRKTVRSIGKTYSPVSSTTPTSTRKYELDADAVTSGNGPASVVSGVGGLVLENNSKITGGDVIVNGKVTVSGNAQIGLSTNPINLRVANQNCPNVVDSTYPRVCTSSESTQPIIANGPIYGNVQATNQTNGANMFNPGLIAGSNYPPVAVPGYNRPAQKAAVTSTYNADQSPITCSGGTAIWPANIKIIGNVNLPNNCVITLSGNVWITGNLSLGNGSEVTVSNSMGSTRPVIMIDGSVGLTFGNNSKINANSSGTGAEIITMWWNTTESTNGNYDCNNISDLLDCTTVVGLALSTSQGVTTINFNNNASAPGSVLRSYWSRTEIANNGALGAVSGQTIYLRQNAVINFTASIPGSSNLVTTWVKRGYIRVF